MKRLLSIALCLLSGCTVGPDYTRPPITQSAHWRNATDAAVSDAPWWTVFGDSKLDALEAEAMQDNLELAQAMSRVEQAMAAARVVASGSRPTLAFEGSLDRSQQSLNSREGVLASALPGYERTTTQATVGLSAAWDLDFAGAIRRQRESALARLDATRAAKEAVRIAVSAEVADAYFTAGALQLQQDAGSRNVALMEEQVALLQQRLSTGDSSRAELDAAESYLHQARAGLPALSAGIEAQHNRLALLLGRDPSSANLPAISPQAFAVAVDPAAGIPSDILRKRPDVRAAEMVLVGANASIGATLAEFYPQLSLGLFGGQQTIPPGDLMSSESGLLQAGLGLRWRLFDFGRLDAQLLAARGKEKEALIAYRLAVLQATADVESSFARLKAMREGLRQRELESASVAALLKASSTAFDAGAINRSDLLQIERQVAGSSADLASARMEMARSVISCARALGGPMPKQSLQ
ncbi:MAG: efflux transporter outer membrane subunit [Moraxellaceae bacterium]